MEGEEEEFNSTILEENKEKWNAFVTDIPQNHNVLTILHVNIRSMIKNFSHLEYIVTSSSCLVQVVVVTEANIRDSCASLFELDDYEMHTELRNHKKGGGVIVYVHNSVKFNRQNQCAISFECIIGEVITKSGFPTYLCAVYRPPDLNKYLFCSELTTIINRSSLRNNYILIGDMNIDLKLNNNIQSQYLNSLFELGFECGINQYTRMEKKGNIICKSCIDHIFIRSVDHRIKNSIVKTAVINNAIADHFITGLTVIDPAIGKYPSYKTVTRIDNKKVQSELTNIDWSEALNYDNPNDVLNYILEKFNYVYKLCEVQVKMYLNKRKQCKWLSNKIVAMCKKRDELFSIWKKDESDLKNRLLYNIYRNKTNKHIQTVKNNYIKKELTTNFRNPKKIWEIVNRLSGKITKSIDDIILKCFKTDPDILTNKFASDFHNNVKNICSKCDVPLLIPEDYAIQPNVSMRLKKAHESIISTIIKHMNINKSPGIDHIRISDLKCINAKLTPIITHLINICIATSLYPDKLKIGTIRPIYKKGSHSDTNNYRPITILSCIDKIIERYFGNQINSFLRKNMIINDKQYGFQKKRSTSELLHKFTNEVNCHLNARKHVLAVFIDFSKAFETLDYHTLYMKLEQNGIQGPLLQWIKDYHTNRYTTVKIAGQYSQMTPTEEGTAQGSIIGPTEYLLYVNDMCNIFQQGSVYQFADDTCLLVADSDILQAQKVMQNNFNSLCKWAHDISLVLNAQKTKIVHIHSPYLKSHVTPYVVAHEHQCFHDNHIHCKCNNLELVPQHMYLGLIIDNKFSWKPHINHICNKLRTITCKLSILKYKLPYQIIRMMYMSLADSLIGYGISSYGRTFTSNIQLMYNIQLRLLKLIVPSRIKIQYEGDDAGLFHYCKVISVYNKIKIATIFEEFCNENRLKRRSRPAQLRKLNYLTRYVLPHYNNYYGKRTGEYTLSNSLNELPTEVLDSLYINKNKVKQILKQHYLKVG